MPIPGEQFAGILGASNNIILTGSSANTYAMAAVNTGIAFRFVALTTADIVSVVINWSSVIAGGTVKLQIETVSAGKPTGTLYDANATISFTPVAGTQTLTFATPPTTGLTIGTVYCVTLLTTVAGTTQTLRECSPGSARLSGYPVIALTAADGRTPSNYAEVANTIPFCALNLEDSTTDTMGMSPYPVTVAGTYLVYGTNAIAMKFNISVSMVVSGVCMQIRIVGTPADHLRIRIFDSSNNVISGSTVTIDKDCLVGIGTTGRQLRTFFPAVITLSSGTYRVVCDSASSANSSNCYDIYSATFLSAASVSSNFRVSSTTDVTASPITWTDSIVNDSTIGLILNAFGAASGGMIVHPGMSGGMYG